ncbi:MAG: ribonuclease E/G [Defluviitaleaceae bacterium]|nr:ribonuclease E/G [Defluviitaleaceae bacterium]
MKKLFIDHHPDRVRTALTEGGRLLELYIDPASSWVGRVIVGRVKTILPGQFAFVDIGGCKNAFMNLSEGHGLKAGQPVLVQVYKDAAKSKGMYVGTEISLKGRLIVLHEGFEVGVSRKITGEKENKRLRKLVRKLLPQGYGAIVRTNAEGQDEAALAAEIQYLHETHLQIKHRAEYALPPAVLYPEATAQSSPLLTDLVSGKLSEIHISGFPEEFAAVKEAVFKLLPGLESRVFHYEPDAPSMFSHYGINRQISAALEKIVKLPCGGFITIEETEACVVIDVNTGSNVGKTDYRATVLETNLEAAEVIAAQIRLRNLSGIIIIDFIDMPAEEDKTTLLAALAAEVKKDGIRTEIIGMIGLGMVQLTRRKTRPPLSQLMETPCPHCGGTGKTRV